MRLGERLDVLILPQVGLAGILDIVVESHDELIRAVDFGCSCRHEFRDDWE